MLNLRRLLLRENISLAIHHPSITIGTWDGLGGRLRPWEWGDFMPTEYDAAVIGGGFFGCMTALELRRRGSRVVLLEQGKDLLLRASYHNQARVHHGYHYPRSLRTALRSRVNFPRFVEQFDFCIERSFDKYYAVARQFSKVTARQFRNFFEHIQAPIER